MRLTGITYRGEKGRTGMHRAGFMIMIRQRVARCNIAVTMRVIIRSRQHLRLLAVRKDAMIVCSELARSRGKSAKACHDDKRGQNHCDHVWNIRHAQTVS